MNKVKQEFENIWKIKIMGINSEKEIRKDIMNFLWMDMAVH